MSGPPPAAPDLGGLYEEVLSAAGSRLPAAKPPRASAAVVLWRRAAGAGGLEVFWLERGHSLPFMGGWYAFPGGGLDRQDAGLQVAGSPAAVTAGQVTPSTPDVTASTEPDLVPGLVACALRELYEETGVLLATAALSAEPAAGECRSAARDQPGADPRGAASRIAAGGATPDGVAPGGAGSLAERLAHGGLALDGGRLTFAGRWQTPPLGPLRFDTRFFLAEWRATSDPEPVATPPESERGEWIDPAAALIRWQRGEVLAAPPVLHTLRVLAEEGPAGALPRLLDPREADLGPLRRIELAPGAVLLPLAAATLPPATHINTFLLGRGEAVLVDPGSPFPAENERLLAALAAAERHHGRRVVAIFLTHHHPDHVAGVETVRRALGVPVAAHPATAERLARRGLIVDRALVDGEIVRLDGEAPSTLRVLHTPGHARGHLCFLLEESGTLICGDLVAGFGTIVIDPPEGDMDQYLESLARMRALAPRLLLPAHGAAIRDAVGKLDEYIAHRLDREAQVLTAWRSGLRDPAAMIPAVYPEVPPMVHPLAARQIRAHLERLARQGRIEAL